MNAPPTAPAPSLLDAQDKGLLRALVCWVRRFAIAYLALWLTLTLAFFALLVKLHGGVR